MNVETRTEPAHLPAPPRLGTVAAACLGVGLDVGRSSTRVVICRVDRGELRYLGHGEAAAGGWDKGRIGDPREITLSVRTALAAASRRAEVDVAAAVVGVAGSSVSGRVESFPYKIDRARRIDAADLALAGEQAAHAPVEPGRVLLQLLPVDFTLDGRERYRSPLGAVCSSLQANVMRITAPAHEHQCLTTAVQAAPLDVEETVFGTFAAAYAAAGPEQRGRGVAVIDIGMHSTGIVIYDGDALVCATSLPLSADHFTRDLALGLHAAHGLFLSCQDAETLKREHGCALRGLTNDGTVIQLPLVEGHPVQEVTGLQLNEVLEARAEELFAWVEREMAAAGMKNSLLEGVRLTGGGAQLAGMCDVADLVLNCDTGYGLPTGIRDWPRKIHTPAWTTAAGLAMYSARLKFEKDWKRRAPGLLGLLWR